MSEVFIRNIFFLKIQYLLFPCEILKNKFIVNQISGTHCLSFLTFLKVEECGIYRISIMGTF